MGTPETLIENRGSQKHWRRQGTPLETAGNGPQNGEQRTQGDGKDRQETQNGNRQRIMSAQDQVPNQCSQDLELKEEARRASGSTYRRG